MPLSVQPRPRAGLRLGVVSLSLGAPSILEHGKLGFELVKRNATFSSLDLGLMNVQKPALVARFTAKFGEPYRYGIVRPFDHITSERRQAVGT